MLLLLLACTRATPAPSPAAGPPAAGPAARPPRPARGKETVLVAAPLPAPPFDGPFALGINEAVSIPGRLLRGMTWEQQASELAADASLTASLGVTLVRGHTGAYPNISQFDLARSPDLLRQADEWVKAVQGAGLEPVGMVSPWPGNDTASVTEHYVPSDMQAYEAYVSRIVERYDADGVEDMPGLAGAVRYWEVDNEPDLKNSTPAKSAKREYDPTLFCTPVEYAQVFLASARAIKAANPTARVLNGGLYRPHSAQGSSYFQAFTAQAGVLDAIDIVSVHTYHDDLDGERLAIGIRNERSFAPQKPVWVTETSLGTTEQIDEEDQARMVLTFVVRSALEGADKLFWHTLGDPPETDATRKMPMFGHSLFRSSASGQRTVKPMGEVYRNLAGILKSHDLTGCTPDGPGAVRLKDGSVLLYEGARAVPVEGINLRTGAALPVGADAAAPAWLR